MAETKKITTQDLTEEQLAIINSDSHTRINAVAGSGKTTTIIHYAASRPKNARILYLAFNRTVRMEAKRKFSDKGLHNVQVETAHSLAYKHIVPVSNYSIRQSSYKTYEIAELLGLKSTGEKHGEYILANHIGRFLTYFCNSQVLKVQDLNYLDIISDTKARAFAKTFYKQILFGTRTLLAKMHSGEIEITHDFYLKMFQLSRPELDFDYILFDEGQDASPAMLDVFLRQKAIKLIVGDSHQQIYSWRHAVNSLDKADFKSYNLSTSFRFNQDIANLAKEILYWKKHLQEVKPVNITGKGQPTETRTRATIARTNLGLLLKAINYISDNPAVNHLYFEGNINSYTYADDGASLYDVLSLYNDQKGRIRDKLLSTMNYFSDLEEYVEKTEDAQLGMMMEIVKEYKNEIPSLIKSLKAKHVGDEEKEKAEMIFSTVHRAKGMEYDEVLLAEDFISESSLEKSKADKNQDPKANAARLNEEINLLYVAITRTKGVLHIPEKLVPANFPPSPHIKITKPAIKKEKDLDFLEMELDLARHRFRKDKYATRAYTMIEKRRAHKNAYVPWTLEKDVELLDMYEKGIPLDEIAKQMGRNIGAIRERLRKLGLGDV